MQELKLAFFPPTEEQGWKGKGKMKKKQAKEKKLENKTKKESQRKAVIWRLSSGLGGSCCQSCEETFLSVYHLLCHQTRSLGTAAAHSLRVPRVEENMVDKIIDCGRDVDCCQTRDGWVSFQKRLLAWARGRRNPNTVNLREREYKYVYMHGYNRATAKFYKVSVCPNCTRLSVKCKI